MQFLTTYSRQIEISKSPLFKKIIALRFLKRKSRVKTLTLACCLLIAPITSFAQYTPGNGVCELPIFDDWSTGGGANPCACLFKDLTYDYTICSYGSCGQAEVNECAADCALYVSGLGYTNGSGWAQGGGDYGENLCINVLSIELSNFYGTADKGFNDIYWATASENKNDYFEIKHSLDGVHYTTLYSMQGAGNSTTEMNYRFLHYNSTKDINYYILKQVDFDGSFVEYGPITIDSRDSKNNALFSDLYPNPSNDLTFFNYSGVDFKSPIKVSILNSAGILVEEISFEGFNIYQGLPIYTSTLSNGVYQVVISQNERQVIQKMSVIH